MEKFSVLLSVYAKENPDYLDSALKSVMNQTLLPNEIVLVKDGPLPKILETVIKQYCDRHPIIKIVGFEENQGLGKALQEGVLHCSFDIIARMDTDDIALSDRFEKQLTIFEQLPEIDVVGSFITEFDAEPSKVISVRKVPISHREIVRSAKRRNPFNHMTVMFRKKAVLQAGNYQPFLWQEDYFLWARMLKQGGKMINIPETLVYARTGKSMFERRGGILYIYNEIRLQIEFFKMGFVGAGDFLFNVSVRTFIRLLPNKLRGYIYIHFLRK